MSAMSILHPRFKLPLHLVQLVLVLAVVILSAVRLLLPGQPSGRNNTIALGMGAKSIIILAYQIGSEHWGPMKRWASLKANAILNSLEIVFWGAVVFLSIQGNIQTCVGTGCILSWIASGIAIVVVFLCVYAALISICEYRRPKKDGSGFSDLKSEFSEESVGHTSHPLSSIERERRIQREREMV